MSLGQVIASGSFTSTGAAKNIPLRSGFDFFETTNKTQLATTQATGRGVKFSWQLGYAADSADMISKKDASNDVTFEVVTSGGFTMIDTSNQTPEAAKATSGTDVAKATSVVTIVSHGYSVGDVVRMYGTTSMLQIAGMEFTITAVPTANSFTLGFIDMSGFAADATAGFARRIPNNPLYAPSVNFITGITQAAQAVVTLSVTHGLLVGDAVTLHVSQDYGMVEADGLVGKVVAINTTNNTITLDIDSSGFTAFAFPLSATAANGVSPAQITPFGTYSNSSDQAVRNDSKIIMKLAAGVDSPAGSASDVIYWRAFKSCLVNNE